ncbi:hypothetical protein P280DRAFT_468403 [Massarina eburnea CBS 473.64]|uniref:2OG-Fe dioxygenase-domain-containing protein n=1 Tax=Massarina eburnea CBS 473.64 TaxID=1395130 RepID=A0A6A6S6W5_9PLEO|nr:hypothetical protein P280DRAFT_468403 [Massarina eburnea CBS 473.64]
MPVLASTLSFEGAVSKILELKKTFERERLVFVKGEIMVSWLRGLGATLSDLDAIQTVSNSLKGDPTLPFRKSKNGRFLFDFDNNQLRRLEFQEFVLSATEDFVRHDSEKTRTFEEVNRDLQGNTALHALFLFQSIMIRGIPTKHRPMLDYNLSEYVCTLFNLRTVTTANLVGEPALEGVHADGVDFTMTTLLGSNNMTDDSAITYVHENAEKTGARWHEMDPKLLRGSHQHKHFMDTLLFADAERKHSLSAVERKDKSHDATRDMLIFFTRKPVVEGHVSYKYDSLVDHKTLPLTVSLDEQKNED